MMKWFIKQVINMGMVTDHKQVYVTLQVPVKNASEGREMMLRLISDPAFNRECMIDTDRVYEMQTR